MVDSRSLSNPSPNRGVMIVLAYLWVLAVVPLLVEKDDPEVQWHAKHGLVLLVAEIVVWMAFGILSIVGSMAFGVGLFLALLMNLVWLAILVIHIVAIIQGINGKRFIIPGISEYANRF
jgi:uncharacterized membrane protein